MNKILFSIILISFLVVPMVGLADIFQINYQNKDYIIQGTLVEGGIQLSVAFGDFLPDAILPFGSLDSYALVTPMDFTPTECRIRHDLIDYGPCAGWTAPGVVTGFTDCCLIDKILTIGDWIFILLLVVAVIVFLIAAWGFLTAQGEPEKVKNARNYVIYSIIGVAVAFLAKVLVRVVASIMT